MTPIAGTRRSNRGVCDTDKRGQNWYNDMEDKCNDLREVIKMVTGLKVNQMTGVVYRLGAMIQETKKVMGKLLRNTSALNWRSTRRESIRQRSRAH
jgi:hypothetical protein